MPAEATIRLQPLDGPWMVAGVDLIPEADPESIQCTANAYGSDTCSFTLRRPPDNAYPDLTAFTPCEIEVAGKLVWSGRVRETPTHSGDDPQINVTGIGWQAQLDDDVYEKTYIHTALSDWQDYKTMPTASIGYQGTAAGSTTVDAAGGAITNSFPVNTAFVLNNPAGQFAVLDLGPSPLSWAMRIVVTYDIPRLYGGQPGFLGALVQGSDNADPFDTTSRDQPLNAAMDTLTATGVTAGYTFSTPRRYVTVGMYYALSGGGGGTLSAESTIRWSRLAVFSSTAYESGGGSNLKASDVIKDARDQATMLLSSDNSLVQSTSYNIPDLAMVDGPKSTREVFDAVNAYHRWRLKVKEDRRIQFSAQPNSPIVKVGSWGGSTFDDASAGSGEEIYNRVIVEATQGDGTPLRLERYAGQQAGASLRQVDSPTPDNPSFDTNTSSWSATSGSLVRDTSHYQSGPASLSWGVTGHGGILTETITGTFLPGQTYALSLWLHADSSGTLPSGLVLQFGAVSAGDYTYLPVYKVNAFGEGFANIVIPWTPQAKRTGVVFRAWDSHHGIAVGIYWFDTLRMLRAFPTLVDRRNFRRTKILQSPAMLDQPGAQQIGDIFLQAHQKTPLKGTLSITGQHGVRRVKNDDTVHPSELLTMTTELIRLTQHVDPDTGGFGRDAVIADVTYNHVDQSAAVSLDNTRGNLDSLLARLAAIQSTGA